MTPEQEQILDWIKPQKTERGRTRTAIATAISDSSQGMVLIDLDVNVIADDGTEHRDTTTAKLPTTELVEKGDQVVITFFDVNGVGRPIVTGVYGGGDRINERLAALEG